MATAEQVARTIMQKLVREQNYLVMMRPADPQPENPPVAQGVLRVDHHDYLVDLERRGILVAAGPTGVVGCAELARLGPNLAEVRSLVVAEPHRGHGVGTRLLRQVVEIAREQRYAKLSAFAYNPRPFVQLGFSIVPHTWLPEKIMTDCQQCEWFRRCEQYAVVIELGWGQSGPRGTAGTI